MLSFVWRRGGTYEVMNGVVKTGFKLVPATGSFGEKCVPYGIMKAGSREIEWCKCLGDAKLTVMSKMVL